MFLFFLMFRLWSTWDLKPVREITFSKSSKPIIRYFIHATTTLSISFEFM